MQKLSSVPQTSTTPVVLSRDSSLPPLPVLHDYYHDEDSRRRRVSALFDGTAGHYNWITTAMSFGSGQWYRRDALRRAGLRAGMLHLDVGAGTGLVTLPAQEIVGAQGLSIALDPSLPMLDEARRAGVRHLVPGRGERLPCADGSFDFLSMGYALRHVTDLIPTFAEYARVLKPGGTVLILEITRPKSFWQRLLLKAYMKGVVPTLAVLFRRSSETRTLMRFYWDTIEHCVPPGTILEALRAVGFTSVRRVVVLGIFSEYLAEKP